MQGYIYNIGCLFSDVAADNIGRTALKYHDGDEVAYDQLEIMSNKIAHYLLSKQFTKGDVIAIFNNKSPMAYATMLAALKIGVIYTNLDLTSPFQRIKKIVERCAPKVILFDIEHENRADVEAIGIPTLDIAGGLSDAIVSMSELPPAATQNVVGSDAAYIMFTSGSTGFPKGAVITHSNLINFINWGRTEYSITKDDICTNANPIYFDNSVFDFYVTIFSGAQLVPLKNDITRDPFKLVKAVADAGCTSWFSVPSLLIYLMTTKALNAHALPAMKRFIFGGEGFPKPKLKKLYEMYHPQAKLYNVYGPTECTCICSSYEVNDADFADMNSLTTLGYLAPNFSYTLINTDETGKFGELCLKGPNVGAGYYNDHERSEKAFIQSPDNIYYKETVYRSGDLVAVDEEGKLHFKGRADNQIKHMGYRIELEEIESLLNTLSCVNEAAVIYDRINESLGQILAYVSISAEKTAPEILSELKGLVPEYMVPRKLFILEQLPKNQNGKIDRVALKNITNNG